MKKENILLFNVTLCNENYMYDNLKKMERQVLFSTKVLQLLTVAKNVHRSCAIWIRL